MKKQKKTSKKQRIGKARFLLEKSGWIISSATKNKIEAYKIICCDFQSVKTELKTTLVFDAANMAVDTELFHPQKQRDTKLRRKIQHLGHLATIIRKPRHHFDKASGVRSYYLKIE
jgi:hypothetical protein